MLLARYNSQSNSPLWYFPAMVEFSPSLPIQITIPTNSLISPLNDDLSLRREHNQILNDIFVKQTATARIFTSTVKYSKARKFRTRLCKILHEALIKCVSLTDDYFSVYGKVNSNTEKLFHSSRCYFHLIILRKFRTRTWKQWLIGLKMFRTKIVWWENRMKG